MKNIQLPYSPIRTEKELNKIFSSMYKARYNRFTWYRIYVPRKQPLSHRNTIEERIMNGDLDYSHYIYQAELVEHRLNKAYKTLFPDTARYLDEHAVDIQRRKKLLEAYNKDESDKLKTILKDCSIRFNRSEKDIEGDMLSFDGDIKQFIKHLTIKYKPKYK